MKKNVLGIDIGGTKIFHAAVNENGEIEGGVKKENTPKTSKEIEDKLIQIINQYDVDTIGIATAGAVNLENNKILSSTANLPSGYADINFKELSKKDIFIENDANCAAWAEYKMGAGKGKNNCIVLTLGTGVGSGIIINGTLLKGKNGAAGEMHFKMSTDKKRKCTCGAWDCFEIYASGNGLKLTYKDLTGDGISTYEIIENAKNGDKNSQNAVKIWNEYIAQGILGLNNIFDTEIIALSGSMVQFADVEFIENYVNSYTVTTKTSVKLCALKNYAGLIGAALIAFDLRKLSIKSLREKF
ncbi:MAG: ROK family protein [Candidatus Gastranaerophilales bacterium]|nr:ROK family protein [Candidatus Gastranaerophilales bacterium]